MFYMGFVLVNYNNPDFNKTFDWGKDKLIFFHLLEVYSYETSSREATKTSFRLKGGNRT